MVRKNYKMEKNWLLYPAAQRLILSMENVQTMTQITKRSEVIYGWGNEILRTMEENGLATIESKKENKRNRYVKLTGKGQKFKALVNEILNLLGRK